MYMYTGNVEEDVISILLWCVVCSNCISCELCEGLVAGRCSDGQDSFVETGPSGGEADG